MAIALGTLGPLAERIALLFITVDPARDTPARLTSDLENFDTRIIGLTESDEQIAAAARAYRVYYSPAEHEKSGTDIVGHTTFVWLMNPTGTFDALVASDVDAERERARIVLPAAEGMASRAIGRIDRFIASYGGNARPFVWTRSVFHQKRPKPCFATQ
jgi:SCO1/SenC